MSRYRQYPKYKDSGVEWIGPIPAHWASAPLKRAVSLSTSRRINVPEGQSYIGLEDVESETGRYSPADRVSRQSEDSTVGLFRAGDVLYGKLRPYLRKSIVAPMDGACSTEFLVLKARSASPHWLHHWLITEAVTQQIEAGCEGAKMPRADWGHVGSIPMPQPPMPEQALIQEALDRETACIDALISRKERFFELLEGKRSAIIHQAVTKGLDQKTKWKESGIEWIGQIPRGWGITPIRRVAKLESGHTPSRSVPAYWENCTIPWFTLADIWQVRRDGRVVITETTEMVSELGVANSSARKLPAGTVILSRTASVGFPAIMGCEMATSQDFAAWICGGKLNNRFLYFCLKAMRAELERLTMGSTHKTIYMPDIEQLRCPLPPIAEQEAIVDALDRNLRKLDSLRACVERSIDLLKERRSALITAALTGQIDLRETT